MFLTWVMVGPFSGDCSSYRRTIYFLLITTKYIVVCPDGRDIYMSLFNHLSNYNELMLGRLKQ